MGSTTQLAMLAAAFIVLALAVTLGSVFAVLHLRSEKAAPVPRWLGALHGAIGVSGLTLLALALRGPARGVAQGAGSFGAIAAWLCFGAALFGLVILARLRKGERAGSLIGIHASLAIGGFVMLAAYMLA